jgi:hypothetical protein
VGPRIGLKTVIFLVPPRFARETSGCIALIAGFKKNGSGYKQRRHLAIRHCVAMDSLFEESFIDYYDYTIEINLFLPLSIGLQNDNANTDDKDMH